MQPNNSSIFDIYQNAQNGVPLANFILHLVLTALISGLLFWVYRSYGKSLSNRTQFGSNFILVSMTTMIIITIVKSSLALSLGLVGALSIVRFRTAIKEPEELAYLFLSVAIGLGFGAGQVMVTLVGFACVLVVIALKHQMTSGSTVEHPMHLTVSVPGGGLELDASTIRETLARFGDAFRMQRADQGPEGLELTFYVEFEGAQKWETCLEALRKLHPKLQASLMETKNFLG